MAVICFLPKNWILKCTKANSLPCAQKMSSCVVLLWIKEPYFYLCSLHLSFEYCPTGQWYPVTVPTLPCCCLVTQPSPTLCDSMDYGLPGSSAHEFSRQGYWSGEPFSFPRPLPDPRIKPESPALQADSLLSELAGKPLPCPTSCWRCSVTGDRGRENDCLSIFCDSSWILNNTAGSLSLSYSLKLCKVCRWCSSLYIFFHFLRIMHKHAFLLSSAKQILFAHKFLE